MSWSEVAFAASATLLVLLWLVWVVASRLDRLHRKVATSGAALENQLVRRASAAAELAASGLLDPVSSVLVGEAAWGAMAAGGYGRDVLVAALPDIGGALDVTGHHAVQGGRGPDVAPADREIVESELSRTVREALADDDEVEAILAVPGGTELVGALAAAWYRVQLARRFHNEAVAQTHRVRRKLVVRLLRLHGHAPAPRTVEIDDAWPEALQRVVRAA